MCVHATERPFVSFAPGHIACTVCNCSKFKVKNSSPFHPTLLSPSIVLGRSIVIHDHMDGSYLTCANIEPAILSATVVNIAFPQGDIVLTDLNFR